MESNIFACLVEIWNNPIRELQEKEKAKEDKKNEKKIERLRKLELKRLEIELTRELKKPVEDMCLKDQEVSTLSYIQEL